MLSLAACVCHELSHLAVMLICKADINAIVLYGAGAKINCELSALGTGKRLAVLAAGCAMNLMLCMIAFLFGIYEFAAVNLIIGSFNMLSIGSLDGAQISEIISVKHPQCTALMRTASIFTVVCAAACAIVFEKHLAPTFFMTIIYMLILKFKGY